MIRALFSGNIIFINNCVYIPRLLISLSFTPWQSPSPEALLHFLFRRKYEVCILTSSSLLHMLL